ncbi:hypothetical protein L665_03862 [Ralstonia solanacearum SD54]|nr:hypothetical protein L665_03862 [Ralstonia solanacearum SD54]
MPIAPSGDIPIADLRAVADCSGDNGIGAEWRARPVLGSEPASR